VTVHSATSTRVPSDIVADVRILHVSWEYPPLVYGGLGRHVGALARAQARAGHEVVVITQTDGEPADHVVEDGVRVIRTPRPDPDLPFRADTIIEWVAGLESALIPACDRLAATWRPQVIHGHDWMITNTVTEAQRILAAPVVATVHATEAGRHQGWLTGELSRSIHRTEWTLCHLATRVIACSQHMRWEVCRLFAIPPESVSVIPNGIDRDSWTTTGDARATARSRFAPSGPLIVYSGRLEWEKGVHTLLEAMPLLGKDVPDAHLVVAGKGGKEADLHDLARRLRLGRRVTFTGWLPEAELHALIASADVAVVPSLYEPFGLVALEATALGTPVVVADTGGLTEIADEGRAALTFPRADHEALAALLAVALADNEGSTRRLAEARRDLQTVYDWDMIARQTTRAYESAVASWDGTPRVVPSPPPLPDANLLAEWEPPAAASG